MKYNKKDVVLSGIRATGRLHLGNYLGAMKYFVDLSKDQTKECFFFVANLHTLTTRTSPDEIKKDLLEIILDYVSVGIDPNVSVIFAQSSVPETCELSWLLSCLSPVADLERMPHYKDKKFNKSLLTENDNAGLLTYPVLMAADILGPRANLVPVGEDQHPHVELARELARRFNNYFGETFPIPELLAGNPVRVPGLDGSEKMGKSDQNTIDLSDSPEIVKMKMAKAKTDTSRVRRNDPGNPAECNVYTFHSMLSTSEEIKEVHNGCVNAGIGCIDCKKIVTNHINQLLEPIQQSRSELVKNGSGYALEILAEGGKRARKVIAKTVVEAKDKMGVPIY